jgi:hypothetical protein
MFFISIFLTNFDSTKTDREMKTAKFKDLIFNSEEEVKNWLKKKTFKIVDFKYLGQDLSRMYIHRSGEILQTDFHGAMYIGRFVDLHSLNEGFAIGIYDTAGKSCRYYDGLVIDQITKP